MGKPAASKDLAAPTATPMMPFVPAGRAGAMKPKETDKDAQKPVPAGAPLLACSAGGFLVFDFTLSQKKHPGHPTGVVGLQWCMRTCIHDEAFSFLCKLSVL